MAGPAFPAGMPMKHPIAGNSRIVVSVEDEHHVSEARRKASQMAQSLGFQENCIYQIATCVSELANNLLHHACGGGTVTFDTILDGNRNGMEVTCEDEGPGIPDIEKAMKDGYTTKGGLGGGLPGASRLMDEFNIRSTVGKGTRIVARMWER